MNNTTTEGSSSFNEAYAAGMAMILQMNASYLSDFKMDSKSPQYLHIVIGSEAEDPDKYEKNATTEDLLKLQNVLLNEMETGITHKDKYSGTGTLNNS